MRILGIIIIAIGILMFIFPEINYTQREKVVDVGPVQVTRNENKTLTWPVYAGGIAIVAGVIIWISSGKKNDD